MSCKKAFKEFENQFNKYWMLYVQSHKDLDQYRGMAITPDNIDAINTIIKDMQDNYSELIDAFMFVKTRITIVEAALREHEIVANGLAQDGEPENIGLEPLQEGQA